jgi:hypothetical protein
MKLGIQSVGFINNKPLHEEELQAECLRRANEFRKRIAEEANQNGTARVVHFPRRNRQDSSGESAKTATLYAMQHDSETDP